MTNQIDEVRELEAIANIINNSDISDNIEYIDPEELEENLEQDEDFLTLLSVEQELSIIF